MTLEHAFGKKPGALVKVAIVALCLLLAAYSLSAIAHGVPQADIDALKEGGNIAYLWLGAKHMLTGYDHLLFLFGVVFFLNTFRDLFRFITAFTVGHSITLLCGTLLSWSVNYYLIDAFIALTVCYKGFENIDGFKRYFQIPTPSLLVMVFIFGLVHGLGLSTRLQQLPLPEDGLVARILSFNVGVELGQLAALSLMVAVLGIWRKKPSFERFSDLANKTLIAIGLLLFLYQLHGYSHSRYADDLGFSADLHNHAHEDMRVEKLRTEHGDSLD